MFKLFVLSAILAIAAAHPGLLRNAFDTVVVGHPEHIAIREPYLTKVGERVETIPTAVSHVYRSDIHSKALVKDVIAPVVRSYAAPAIRTIAVHPELRTFETPLLKSYEAPLLKSYEAPLFKSYEAPLLKSYGTPLLKYDAPLLKTIASPVLRSYETSPIIRSTFGHEANFLKTHAESAPGVSLSTFETKPVAF